MSHDIFISYSRRNLAKIKPIKEELETQGFSCWMDIEGIESGSEEFSGHLAKAISNAKAFLFFLSTSSQKSEWSLKEIRFAKTQGKRVVIVRFNDCGMTDAFSFNYGGDDIVDWRVAEQKEKLLKDLRRWTRKGEMRKSKTPCTSTKSNRKEKNSATKKTRKLPISMEFVYTDLSIPPFTLPKMRFYQLNVKNHRREPIDITISVSNGRKHKAYRQIIAGNSTEHFRTLGGGWRFTHGDQGTIKVLGWAELLKFCLDADGVLITQ